MRNHIEILKEIDQVLSQGGFAEERQQLENEIRASSSGGELCMMAGAKLLSFQISNSSINFSIGHLINEFIAYCHHNGLYPRP